MDKNRIDRMIPYAYDALSSNTKIVQNGKINKTYRSAISSFGAAMAMGSMISAVAFFNANGGSKVDRKELSKVIFEVIKKDNEVIKKDDAKDEADSLYNFVKANSDKKEQVMDAAVAVKLAMNLFELVEEKIEERR